MIDETPPPSPFEYTRHFYSFGYYYKIIFEGRVVGRIQPLGPSFEPDEFVIFRGVEGSEEAGRARTLEIAKALTGALYRQRSTEMFEKKRADGNKGRAGNRFYNRGGDVLSDRHRLE